MSTDPPDLMPLSSFLSKSRPRPPPTSSYLSPPALGSYPTTLSPQLTGDPLLSGSTPKVIVYFIHQLFLIENMRKNGKPL